MENINMAITSGYFLSCFYPMESGCFLILRRIHIMLRDVIDPDLCTIQCCITLGFILLSFKIHFLETDATSDDVIKQLFGCDNFAVCMDCNDFRNTSH